MSTVGLELGGPINRLAEQAVRGSYAFLIFGADVPRGGEWSGRTFDRAVDGTYVRRELGGELGLIDTVARVAGGGVGIVEGEGAQGARRMICPGARESMPTGLLFSR